MGAAPRVRPADVFTPEEWAPFTRRSAWRGLALVAHAWGVIGLAMAAAVVWPILIPLAVMIIGTRQLGLAILMHEAAHGALHPNLKVNDAVGHWLCAAPVGASLDLYRPYHLSHHKHAQQPEDPDLVLSAPFPVSRASLWRKIIRDLTGQTFIKQRLVYPVRALRTARDETAEGAVVTSRAVLAFFVTNAVLASGLILMGVGWAYLVLWLLPMATWFPLVTRLRNIAEHACVEGSADDAWRAARTTRAGWIERAFIAPYWVNHHAEHHLFMHVPCWNLPRLSARLAEKGLTARMEIAPGYLSVLRQASSG